jgi:hypothetical protein
MLTERDANYIEIQPQAVRVAEASKRVLSVIEERGTPDQVERVRSTFTSSAPPPAHHPMWPLFAAEAIATLAELTDRLLKEHEPKRGRGRPRRSQPKIKTDGGES